MNESGINQESSNQGPDLNLSGVVKSASKLLTSGIALLEAKADCEVQSLTRQAWTTIVLVLLTFLGVSAILTGVVILLGDVWGHRYGLSSITVGAGCIIIANLFYSFNGRSDQ